MQMPNKLYSYKESTLSKLPVVMRLLSDGPVRVGELYRETREYLDDATDFLSVMDCLYALGKTDINENGEAYLC